jgi:hypothetical protein
MSRVDQSEIEKAATALAEVLDQVDAGDIEATPSQRAYIQGSLDTLRELGKPEPV